MASSTPFRLRLCGCLSLNSVVVLASLGLGGANAVDEVANAALRDDVGDGVASLDSGDSLSGEASLASLGAGHHREDVHDWVGAPREDGCPTCPLDLVAASLRLSLLGVLEADEEGVDDVHEWAHGCHPEEPAGGSITGGLARVAVSNHEAREQAKLPAALEGLSLREAHDKDDLDEEQRDGKEPVNIAVCVVESNASWGVAVCLSTTGVVVDGAVGHFAWGVCGVEGVEDTEVVVHGDEGHEAGEAQSCAVLLLERAEAQEEEDGGRRHGRKAQGGHVVDQIMLRDGQNWHHHG